MLQEIEVSEIATELRSLYKNGSGEPVLSQCSRIMALGPVVVISREHVEAPAAARALLKLVLQSGLKKLSQEEQWQAVVAGALTGIEPHQAGTSTRGSKGTAKRRANAGARHQPPVHERTIATYLKGRAGERFFTAFAHGILLTAGDIEGGGSLANLYRKKCGLGDPPILVTRNGDSDSSSLQEPELDDDSEQACPASQRDSMDEIEGNGRPSLISSTERRIRDAVDQAEADGYQFFTIHLMLTLMSLPDGAVRDVLEDARPGLGRIIESRLRNVDDQQRRPAFKDGWPASHIASASRLASSQGFARTTTLHLLLAILNERSNTRNGLASILNRYDLTLNHIMIITERRLTELKTGTPDLARSSTDGG